jgi:ABC-type cobalamin/Fe3+-siderophores transport system ATPase subunit
MIQRLEIENFRGLDKLCLDGLARINVLVGANNVGKTSVLEAMSLVCNAGREEVLVQLMQRRRLPEASGRALGEFVHNVGTANTANSPPRLVATGADLTFALAFDAPGPGPQQVAASLSIAVAGAAPEASRIPAQGTVGDIGATRPVAVWADGAATSELELAKRLGALQRRNQLGDLVKATQGIDWRIRDFAQIEDLGAPHMEGYVQLEGIKEWLALSQLGSGFRSMVALFTLLVGQRDAVVLVDEFENGLHHDAMASVWQAIHALSVANNLQVFVSTHSQDCLRAVHAVLAPTPADLVVYRLQRGQSGQVVPVRIDHEVLGGILGMELEVR